MTCCQLGRSSDTGKARFEEPPFPSAALGEPIDSTGTSSSVIVPVPVLVPMAAFTALLNSTTTVSFGSSAVSPVTETGIVRLVAPGPKVSFPEGSAV